MSAIETLLNRNSHPRLVAPGPDEAELETILRAALRAPDHGRLRPWRFVVIAGDRREAVSYTHLRAHETDSYLVCRLLLEKKKSIKI